MMLEPVNLLKCITLFGQMPVLLALPRARPVNFEQ